jgi:hypothetical protein
MQALQSGFAMMGARLGSKRARNKKKMRTKCVRYARSINDDLSALLVVRVPP